LNRDFGQYQTWAWATPSVTYAPDDPRLVSDRTTQRVEEAVAAQLDVRGLRPATDPAAADLQVRASVVVEMRRDNFTTHHGCAWRYGGTCWGEPGYPQTRTVYYQVMMGVLDFKDWRYGRPVWRGSDS